MSKNIHDEELSIFRSCLHSNAKTIVDYYKYEASELDMFIIEALIAMADD